METSHTGWPDFPPLREHNAFWYWVPGTVNPPLYRTGDGWPRTRAYIEQRYGPVTEIRGDETED